MNRPGYPARSWQPALAAAIVLAVLLFPVYWMVHTAISPIGDVLSRTPQLIADQPTFDAFRTLLGDPLVRGWFRNSAIITFASATVSTFAATLAGYALSRFRAPGSQSVIFTMFLGRVLPGTLLALPFFVMFRLVGLMGTFTAVVIANTSMILPFATMLMKNFFDSIPIEIDDAARVDGCTRLGALWRILLPLSTTGIAAAFIFAATASWVDLLFARTLLHDDAMATVPVGIASMIGEVQIDWNMLMAAGTLSVVPVFIVYWFAQRFLVEGMTAGAVKG